MTAPIDAASPRHRLRLLIVAAVVVSVAAIAATYLIFFTGDSPPPLRLSAQVTTTAPTAATAADPTTTAAPSAGATPTTAAAAGAGASAVTGRWSVGSGSRVGYRVREKLARLPAQSDAVGRTSAVTGSIQVDRTGSQLVVADGARFEADVTKLQSDESQRDSRIRTMGLESNRFPKATFVSTGAIEFPGSAESGAPVKTDVTGDLTIHGVTKRVTIPLDAQITGGRIEVVGTHTFPFSEFGMTPPSIGGIVTVTDNATLEFQLFFDKA